jgi:hypothetical protein
MQVYGKVLAPKYSTKPGVVPLTEDEIDDLVDEWTPEPLVGSGEKEEEKFNGRTNWVILVA